MICDRIRVFGSAADLPGDWDTAARNQILLTRQSLLALEQTNPCGQKYHMTGQNELCSVAVTYQHSLNLLTYLRGSFRLPVTIIGVPCSVSACGFSLAPQTSRIMIEHILAMRGAKLVLNSNGTVPATGFAKGTTLPTCRLQLKWDIFDEYLAAMRSHYRYRCCKALARWQNITASVLPDNLQFCSDLHQLYLNVLNRSKVKLEQLGVDFFRKFPATIVVFRAHGKPLAFVQLLANGRELVFMFGGMDYGLNKDYDIYLNMLLYIVRAGIEGRYESIDMGQTAEAVKQKLGCHSESKFLLAAHSNRVAHLALKAIVGPASYKPSKNYYNVFKQQ